MTAATGSLHLWRFTARLLAGAAAAAILVPASAWAQPATVETVTVTGTNIRGAAPVGEPVISLGRDIIEQTAAVSVQQLLQTAAPQVNSFGSAGQTSGSYEPRLRSLGGSSSAATLVLVDGHRINPGGGIANTADPNIIPAGAIANVQILADGASAVYGSDAVAGVINIITRKDYSGFELNFQTGFAADYDTLDSGLTFGNAWDNGGVLASYEYSHRSDLLGSDRPFVSGNQSNSGPGATGKSGGNFNNYNCSPATVIPATGQPGAGQVFVSPYATGTGLTNNSLLTGQCSQVGFSDLLPETIAHRLFITAHQKLGSRVNVSASLAYNNNVQVSASSRGTVSNVTVWGPGSTPAGGVGQINPFFAGPPGVTVETVSYDFNQLFGPGATSRQQQEGIMGTLAADIDISDGWIGNLTLTAGDPHFSTVSSGTVNAPSVDQALNGTSSSSGTTTTNLIGNSLGTTTSQTRLPLTTANAFNPFSAGAAGTSAAVLSSLLTNQTISNSSRPILDFVAKVDGSLFTLPGGDIKLAIGGEYYSFAQTTDSAAIAPLSGITQAAGLIGHTVATTRHVLSGFAELNIPLVGEGMNIPFVHKLSVDVAGRIDKYNDLAAAVSTPKTPKIGVSWTPVNDLVLRGAYGTSFVAPFVGTTQLGTIGSTINGYFSNGSAQFTLPQGYPNSAFLGCPATGTCTVTAAGGKDGIVTFGGNPNLRPQTGIEWSTGADWVPKDFLKGLHASVTYWGATYKGVITNQANVTVAASTPGLESVLVIGPSATQIAAAEAGRTTVSVLPTTISFINNIVQQNFFNFRAEGLDFDIGYGFDSSWGVFSFDTAGTIKTKFVKQLGTGPWVNALNVVNTTNTFSPTKFVDRSDFGWRGMGWSADLYVNYMRDVYATDTNPAFAASACPFNVTTTGLGCQHIAPNITLDTHLAYDVNGSDFFSQGLQLYLNITNLLDKNPPFVDAADGITPNGSLNNFYNPIGRTFTFGFRKKW